MPKTKQTYTEIDDIKGDLNSLRANVVELTKHLKSDSKERTSEMTRSVLEGMVGLKSTGREKMTAVEERVKSKPLESVAMAFAAGAVLSLLMGRK